MIRVEYNKGEDNDLDVHNMSCANNFLSYYYSSVRQELSFLCRPNFSKIECIHCLIEASEKVLEHAPTNTNEEGSGSILRGYRPKPKSYQQN